MAIDRFDHTVCCNCARQATGYGYAPDNLARVMWVCDDPECLQIAKSSYKMRQDQFTRIESAAAYVGFEAMCMYLAEIGKLDLNTLTTDEAFEAARRQVAGYRKALKDDLKNEAPF